MTRNPHPYVGQKWHCHLLVLRPTILRAVRFSDIARTRGFIPPVLEWVAHGMARGDRSGVAEGTKLIAFSTVAIPFGVGSLMGARLTDGCFTQGENFLL